MPRNEGGKGGEGGEYPFTTFSAFGSRGLKKTQSIYAGSSLVHAGAGPEPPLRPRDLPPRGRLQVRDDNTMPPHPSRLHRIARWGRLPLIFFCFYSTIPTPAKLARHPRPRNTRRPCRVLQICRLWAVFGCGWQGHGGVKGCRGWHWWGLSDPTPFPPT